MRARFLLCLIKERRFVHKGSGSEWERDSDSGRCTGYRGGADGRGSRTRKNKAFPGLN